MWETKDFVAPHFNYIDHFEKPVLSYFLASLCVGIWGVNSLAVRLPSILSAILGLFLTHFFTKRFFGKDTADLSAMILATSIGYFFLGRYGMIDMLMTFFLSAALFCFCEAVVLKNRRFYPAAYLAMGFAFITKGLIGVVLPGAVVFFYLLWAKDLGEVKRMRLGQGLLITAAVFIPWGIAMSMREPEFSYVFITQQHFQRFATGSFGRSRPFWFFIPILIAFSFPWSFFFPAAAVRSLRSSKGEEKNVVRFLLSWIAVIFIFFSIPKSKLPYYILPISAPLAVVVALWIRRAQDTQLLKGLFRGIGWISILSLAGLNAYLFIWATDPRAAAVRGPFLPATICALLGAAAIRSALRKDRYPAAAWRLGGTLFAMLLFIASGMARLTPFFSTQDEAVTMSAYMKPGDIAAVYSSPDHFSDLPFHLRRRVMVVGSDRGTLSRELEEEEHTEDLKEWFPETGAFADRFNSRRDRIFCLMKTNKLPELQHVGLRDYTVIKEGAGKLIISNEP